MSQSSHTLIAKLGCRSHGDRNGLLDTNTNQRIAYIIRVELNRFHLAHIDAAIANLRLHVQPGDILRSQYQILVARLLLASEPLQGYNGGNPEEQHE